MNTVRLMIDQVSRVVAAAGLPAGSYSYASDVGEDDAQLATGTLPVAAEHYNAVTAIDPDGAEIIAAELAALKASLKAAVDAAAEAERLRHITGGAGQAMEYQQASAEADTLLAALAVDPEHVANETDYPMLMASVGVDGDTLAEVAVTVSAMHAQWRAVGAAIRGARLAAKAAIDVAQTSEAALVAAEVSWPAAD